MGLAVHFKPAPLFPALNKIKPKIMTGFLFSILGLGQAVLGLLSVHGKYFNMKINC
jgi:hypothetical protein